MEGVEKSLDEEAVRVVQSMPKWTPGQIDEKTIRSYKTIPVVFWIPDWEKGDGR